VKAALRSYHHPAPDPPRPPDNTSSSLTSTTRMYSQLNRRGTGEFLAYVLSMWRRVHHTADIFFGSAHVHFVLRATSLVEGTESTHITRYSLGSWLDLAPHVLVLFAETMACFQLLALLHLFPMASGDPPLAPHRLQQYSPPPNNRHLCFPPTTTIILMAVDLYVRDVKWFARHHYAFYNQLRRAGYGRVHIYLSQIHPSHASLIVHPSCGRVRIWRMFSYASLITSPSLCSCSPFSLVGTFSPTPSTRATKQKCDTCGPTPCTPGGSPRTTLKAGLGRPPGPVRDSLH